jgi:hypothetical protein
MLSTDIRHFTVRKLVSVALGLSPTSGGAKFSTLAGVVISR